MPQWIYDGNSHPFEINKASGKVAARFPGNDKLSPPESAPCFHVWKMAQWNVSTQQGQDDMEDDQRKTLVLTGASRGIGTPLLNVFLVQVGA